jgi:hypothetical protein
MESLQEFRIQTSGMSAEYGRAQAGVFNYVMKSGTNEIHGSAYGMLRNEALNANTFAIMPAGSAVRPTGITTTALASVPRSSFRRSTTDVTRPFSTAHTKSISSALAASQLQTSLIHCRNS